MGHSIFARRKVKNEEVTIWKSIFTRKFVRPLQKHTHVTTLKQKHSLALHGAGPGGALNSQNLLIY